MTGEQMTPNEKRLKALADDHFRNARDLSQRVATLQATVERQAAEIAEVRASAETVIQIAVAAATKAERARMIAAMREPDALERLLDAVTDVANIVSYDGYYEIDKESATNALDAALSAATDHMETRNAG